MRVLLASTSGAGHLGPLLPFAAAVRRAGHELLVTAPFSAQPAVERAGLPFISFADPPEREREPVWERARSALAGVELAIDAWRPDVVVRESCEFASAVAAEARDIPVARVGIGTVAKEAFAVRAAAPAVDALRRWAGLEPDPAGARLSASPYLTLTPASVEPPGAEAPARTLRFHAAPPPLRAVRSDAATPLVHVRLGDRAVAEALAELPIRPAGESSQADAMVGDGDFGPTLGALLAGVPQVVVPRFGDQPDTAERIAALGAGLVVREQDPAAVRAAVERLLAEPAFRVAAGRVALEAQGLPSIDEAPAALEALAAAQGRRTPSRASSASASAR